MISPSDDQVIVFVHGESYEWNSGNPYDGSVLASYGQVRIFDFDLKSIYYSNLRAQSHVFNDIVHYICFCRFACDN